MNEEDINKRVVWNFIRLCRSMSMNVAALRLLLTSVLEYRLRNKDRNGSGSKSASRRSNDEIIESKHILLFSFGIFDANITLHLILNVVTSNDYSEEIKNSLLNEVNKIFSAKKLSVGMDGMVDMVRTQDVIAKFRRMLKRCTNIVIHIEDWFPGLEPERITETREQEILERLGLENY
jgi:hypothetical protein